MWVTARPNTNEYIGKRKPEERKGSVCVSVCVCRFFHYYTTTVVCCGERIERKKTRGEGRNVCEEEGLVTLDFFFFTETERPSRRTKSKQKDCRPFFFLYAKRVFHRWLPLSSSAVTLEIPFHFGFPLIFLFLFFVLPPLFFSLYVSTLLN